MVKSDSPQNQPQIGEFALLEVVEINRIGAFLDWGQPKDLFLPYSEQTRNLYEGDKVVVFIYNDRAGRPCASMKLDKFAPEGTLPYEVGQEVSIIIYAQTDLGYKAIINRHDFGILYYNEVFEDLELGETRKAYIRQIREDGKIDLSIHQTGHKGADEIGQRILDRLAEFDGYLAINDQTPPEEIYRLFAVSKKKFKMALGGLLKKELVYFEREGIRDAKTKSRRYIVRPSTFLIFFLLALSSA